MVMLLELSYKEVFPIPNNVQRIQEITQHMIHHMMLALNLNIVLHQILLNVSQLQCVSETKSYKQLLVNQESQQQSNIVESTTCMKIHHKKNNRIINDRYRQESISCQYQNRFEQFKIQKMSLIQLEIQSNNIKQNNSLKFLFFYLHQYRPQCGLNFYFLFIVLFPIQPKMKTHIIELKQEKFRKYNWQCYNVEYLISSKCLLNTDQFSQNKSHQLPG
ncbi:unnamed protein product [Paramecium octaurelia]|uniref:Uncharacterized protein n=1 Tax=Paramecium octaurelia TaxID=43137 RepID=A0A8S1SSF9_PAROT|nr:unnamed protein product [Paramecium octaurelia]